MEEYVRPLWHEGSECEENSSGRWGPMALSQDKSPSVMTVGTGCVATLPGFKPSSATSKWETWRRHLISMYHSFLLWKHGNKSLPPSESHCD